jgi:hypothetical protein
VAVETRGAARIVPAEGQRELRVAVFHDDKTLETLQAGQRPRERPEIHARPRPAVRDVAQ